MNWAVFGLAVSGVMLAAWIVLAFGRKWSAIGLVVSLACLVTAAMNSAAPVRGAIDPAYMGFTFGALHADAGLNVTLTAGTLFLSAIVASMIALLTKRGPLLLFVAGFCGMMLVVLGWPWLIGALTDMNQNSIEFGEYLAIPGWLGTILLFVLLVLPFGVGLVWSVREAIR
jgi:hypothetical protein